MRPVSFIDETGPKNLHDAWLTENFICDSFKEALEKYKNGIAGSVYMYLIICNIATAKKAG